MRSQSHSCALLTENIMSYTVNCWLALQLSYKNLPNFLHPTNENNELISTGYEEFDIWYKWVSFFRIHFLWSAPPVSTGTSCWRRRSGWMRQYRFSTGRNINTGPNSAIYRHLDKLKIEQVLRLCCSAVFME